MFMFWQIVDIYKLNPEIYLILTTLGSYFYCKVSLDNQRGFFWHITFDKILCEKVEWKYEFKEEKEQCKKFLLLKCLFLYF